MGPGRKRRSNDRDASPDESSHRPPPQRRRRSSSSSASNSDSDSNSNATNTIQPLAKKLIRLALSTEYSRTPLRRTDISTKILASQPKARNFKAIFALAQAELQAKFGMQLVELPSREKADLKSRRQLVGQGAKVSDASSSNKSWILVSTLPEKYKTDPAIVAPIKAGGSQEAEAAYTALYSFVISVIYLNNGVLPEAKLERYLKRVNAETYTPVGTRGKVLMRMAKDGYLEKRRDTSNGEENIEWVVGPRGKVEVGIRGVTGLVKGVYGFPATPAEAGGEEELERKLRRSLGIKEEGPRIVVSGGDAEGGSSAVEAAPEEPRTRGRPRKAPARDDGESGDDG